MQHIFYKTILETNCITRMQWMELAFGSLVLCNRKIFYVFLEDAISPMIGTKVYNTETSEIHKIYFHENLYEIVYANEKIFKN